MVRIEDIIFWILILSVIGVVIWLSFGSPDFESSLLALMIFVANSGILLWKFLFNLDKKTAVGFEKVRNHIGDIKRDVGDINSRFGRIEEALNKINKKLKIR